MSRPRARAILIPLLAAGLSAAAWGFLAGPAASFADRAAAEYLSEKGRDLTGDTGLVLSYESLSPLVFGRLLLRGVSASSGGVELIRIGMATVEFDPLAALRGTFSISRVRFEDVRASVDLVHDADLLERLSRLLAGTDGAEPGPNPLVGAELELRRLSFTLDTGTGIRATVEAGHLDARLGQDGFIDAGMAGRAVMASSDPALPLTRADIPFELTARAPLSLDDILLFARVSVDSDMGSVPERVVRAAYRNGRLDAAFDGGDGLSELEVSYVPASNRLGVRAAFEDFRADSLFRPAGSLSFLAPWLAHSLDGALSLDTDLTLEGSSVELSVSGPSPVELPGGPAFFECRAAGTWDSLDVERFSLESTMGRIVISGRLRPSSLGAEGRVDAALALEDGTAIKVAADVYGAGDSWFVYAPTASAGPFMALETAVSIEVDGQAVGFYAETIVPDDAAMEAFGSGAPVEPAAASGSPRVSVEGTLTLGDEPYVAASASIDSLALGSYRWLVTALTDEATAATLAAIRIGGELSVFSDFRSVSLGSPNALVVLEGPTPAFGVVSFTAGPERLAIRSLDATIAGLAVSGSGTVEYAVPGRVGAVAELTVEGVPFGLDAAIVPDAVFLTGSYGLDAALRRAADGFSLALSFDSMPVPTAPAGCFLSLDADGRYAAPDDWQAIVGSVRLESPDGMPWRFGSIEAAGTFDQAGGALRSLTLRDDVSELRGTADVTWHLLGGFRTTVEASLAGPGGESYRLEGGYDGATIDAHAAIARAPLDRLESPGLVGVIDADVRASGAIDDPVILYSFKINDGARPSHLAFVAGGGSYNGGLVEVRDARVFYLGYAAERINGLYRVDSGSLDVTADVKVSLGISPLVARIEASGYRTTDAPVDPDAPLGPLNDYVFDGWLRGFSWGGSEPADLPVRAEIVEGTVSASLGPAEEFRLSYSPAGDLSVRMARSLPVSCSIDGVLIGTTVSLDVADARVDLPYLFKFFAIPAVVPVSGTGAGSLRIRGQSSDPELEGSFEFEDFYLKMPDFLSEPLGPITAPLFFTGRTMEVAQSGLPSGPSTIDLRLDATIKGWAPSVMRIVVDGSEQGMIGIRAKLLGLDLDARGRPRIVVDVTENGVHVDGSVDLQQGDLLVTTEVITGSGDGEYVDLSGLTVDMDIGFGKAVKVYFPDKRIPVIMGQTDPSSRLSVAFEGATGYFTLKGRALLRGGNVFYIQRNFYLRTASMEFDENAASFDPIISLEAENRTRSDTGPVVVKLSVDDSRLSSLAFRLSSTPGMSEAEIARILGLNLTGAAGGQDTSLGEFIVENVDAIPGLNVAGYLERTIREGLGLDVLFFKTLFLQRFTYDVLANQEQDLAQWLEGTEIIAGKYLNDFLYLQAGFNLQYDPLAEAIPIVPNVSLSLDWTTPYFIFNWELQPFNAYQAFSFYWSYKLK